ncbi:nuclear transport factor 2 family protein [Nonomuraea sp. NPDC005650]|uniref:nuclear transport factor 2 family protein n=1 Tax=Nonomuraea sp. NPDC005650 TaxID=3157045 RepID=UPI0033B1173C
MPAVLDELEQLRRRVRELSDREEITDLVYRLGAVLDEGRFDELSAIFSEDATALTPGGLAEGRSALIAQAGRNHSPEERIQHVIGNVLVNVDGNRARVRANLIATFAAEGASEVRLAPAPRLILGEVYHFEAIRTGQGWRLSRVETTPVWASQTETTPRPGDS